MTRIVHLTPPKISYEHIKSKITCIRAHRERLFAISSEIINGKLICHNYGQGGAGWTFLFGSVNESMRQFEEHVAQDHALKNKPIVVIGAGCYGLLTAITLARAGYTVRIVAKETENTASSNAAGFFFPRSRKTSTPQENAIFQSLGMESFVVHQQIIKGKHPFIRQGIEIVPIYFGLDIDPGFSPYVECNFMAAPEKVVIDFGTGKRYEVMEYKTLFINSTLLLAELKRAITELKISITKAEIESFLDLPESIIFNCTGAGAKKLTGDKRLINVQGHLITLKNQPDSEKMRYMLNVKVVMTDTFAFPRDELIYYSPKGSGVLGITFIRGKRALLDNEHEFDRILLRCHDFFGV